MTGSILSYHQTDPIRLLCEIDLKKLIKEFRPQYLIDENTYKRKSEVFSGWKLTLMDVTSATNTRTVISTPGRGLATVDSCRNLVVNEGDILMTLQLGHLLNCLVFDWMARFRVGGLHITWFQLEEMTVPDFRTMVSPLLPLIIFRLCGSHVKYASDWIHFDRLLPQVELKRRPWTSWWALQLAERLRLKLELDVIGTYLFGIDKEGLDFILRDCDHPCSLLSSKNFSQNLNPKGFWRVDKDKDPELRHTVLTLVAFYDLEQKIRECGGDRDKGIETFLNQNDGEGWMLPETLRLADYGLGHDERAQEYQPVASRLGPRFYDWQLVQSPEESWRECHPHARNLLGQNGYLNLLAEVRDTALGGWHDALEYACDLVKKENFLKVFSTTFGYLPPDSWRKSFEEARKIFVERNFTLDQPDMIQILVEALKQVPKEDRPEGIVAARRLLSEADFREDLRDVHKYINNFLRNRSPQSHPCTIRQTNGG